MPKPSLNRGKCSSSGTPGGTGEDLSADLGAGWARADLKQQSKAANFVASKARDQGRVRVIVGVKAPRPPPTGGSQSLQNYIANVQQEAMGSLGWVNFNDLVRLKHTPQLVMSVDAGELDQLIQSRHVASVHEDSPNKAFLSRSAGVIGRPVTNQIASIGAGQVVAVLDTGVDPHPFIAPNIAAEACFSTNRKFKDTKISSACPNGAVRQVGRGAGRACDHRYNCSHGTHVAGIVAGKSARFSGVAPGAKILAVQVFSLIDSRSACGNKSGKCATSFDADLIRALSWVYEQRNQFNIAAVNLSLGGGRFPGNCKGPLRPILDKLQQAGIAVIAASGNEKFPDSMSSPACLPNTIAVGATGYGDNVAKFSNSSSELDLLAPGTSVVPGQRGAGILSSVLNGKFARMGGTSMAAPHVAGAFAAIKSAVPNARAGDVLKALTVTGARVRDSKNGLVRPRIRIDAAIRYLRQHARLPPKPAPAPQPRRAPKPQPKPAPESREKNYDGIKVLDGREKTKDGKIKW